MVASSCSMRSAICLVRFAIAAPLLIRAADREKVAHTAGPLGRSRRQHAELDGAIDDLEHLDAHPPRPLVDRNGMIREAARRRAVREAAALHRAARGFLDGEAVDDRLQLRSPTDEGALRRAVLSCLVVGDPQNLRPGLALDEIDRAAKDEPAVDRDRILDGWLDRVRAVPAGRTRTRRANGSHSAFVASWSTHTRRSVRMLAISSCQTRSIAGARRS